jgi:hypothetical protein
MRIVYTDVLLWRVLYIVFVLFFIFPLVFFVVVLCVNVNSFVLSFGSVIVGLALLIFI